MQWAFLVLALWAALLELHSGTFYLAAIATVALLTFVLGFWVREDLLLMVFVAGCLGGLGLIWVWRRSLPRGRGLPDLDAGGEAIVTAIGPEDDRLVVTYRGTRWDAVMEHGPPPAIGTPVRITRKTGSLLHLAAPAGAAPSPTAPSPPAQEPP